MNNLKDIQSFLQADQIAVAGVSRNPKKFGREVFEELRKKGYNLIPLNPHTEEIAGVKCYKSVSDLPDGIQHLYITTPKEDTEKIVQEAVSKGIGNIWIQQMSDTPEAVQFAEKNNINLIHKKCIFMFAEPVSGVHKFHRFLMKIFGLYPN